MLTWVRCYGSEVEMIGGVGGMVFWYYCLSKSTGTMELIFNHTYQGWDNKTFWAPNYGGLIMVKL